MDQGTDLTITINNTRGGHIIQNNIISGSVYINGRDVKGEEIKCLRALFLTDPRADRGDIVNRNGMRVNGTCEWITDNETYISWLFSRSELLWLCGGPGKGKTTLAIYLAERLEEYTQDCFVLEYYCSSQDEKRNTHFAVVRGLIYQLLRQFPELFRHVLSNFEIQSTSFFTSSFAAIWSTFEAMIRDPILPAIYCVLDGLDEIFDEQHLNLLLTNISALFSVESVRLRGSPFKMIIVSREFPDCLLRHLSKFPRIQVDPADDIRRFIEVRVDELAENGSYSTPLISHVKKVFSRRAEGTFLWVAVVAKELRTYRLIEVEEALDRFASGLDGLYTQILCQIPEGHRKVAARVLSWVTLAVRPLTVPELGEALETKSKAWLGSHPEITTRDALKYCGNFVNVAGSTVYLVHQSAKEFLLRKTNYSDPLLEIFRVDEYLANLEIARTCLDYFYSGAFRDGAFDIRKDNRRLEEFPLLKYAILHWFEHTRLLSSSESIFDHSFYKQKSVERASWLRTYWAVGELRKGGEPVSSPESFPILHLASYFGILPVVQKIVLKGRWKKTFHLADERVNQIDSRGQTPLIWAAKNGHWPVVKLLLLEPNILADFRDASGETPLYFAAKGGYYTIAAVLLQRPDVVADSKNETGSTPLMIAALGGHEAVVRILIAREDVDINSRDNQGSTSLYWACWLGHESVVRLLLERPDVEPNLEDVYGQSPLRLAAREGHDAVVRLLLERSDIAPDSQHQLKDTPLHYAVEQGHEQVVHLLLARSDVDVNKKTNLGSTSLNLAAKKGHGAIVRILLNKPGIEPDLADSHNRTPLSFAAQEGHAEIAALLLSQREVDINSKDFRGETPLHHSARLGHEGVARLLLQRPDIEPDSRNINNHTPIVKAAQSEDDPLWSGGGHEAIVRMLLGRSDVNIDYKDDLDWRPLYDGARTGRNEGIIQLLQSLRPDWGSWTYRRKVRDGTLVERMAPSNL